MVLETFRLKLMRPERILRKVPKRMISTVHLAPCVLVDEAPMRHVKASTLAILANLLFTKFQISTHVLSYFWEFNIQIFKWYAKVQMLIPCSIQGEEVVHTWSELKWSPEYESNKCNTATCNTFLKHLIEKKVIWYLLNILFPLFYPLENGHTL